MKLFRILSLLLIFAVSFPAFSQELLGNKDRDNAVKEIVSGYKNWNAAAWQAGVRTQMLPLTVTMKVYMKRGELTLISLRAPILGEVGRIEIDKEKVLLINKMKKRYWEKPMAQINALVPNATEALQSLMLGRVVVLGSGELSKKNGSLTEIFNVPDAGWLIVPQLPDGIEGGAYGYAVDYYGQLTDFVLTAGDDDSAADSASGTSLASTSRLKNISAMADINYDRKGDADAVISLKYGNINLSATVDVDAIEWGAKGFDRLQLSSSYRKSSLKECLSF